MSGAWRLWTEHAGIKKQVQGDELSAFDTTNPDHVFEIHPIDRLGSIALFGSFIPIEGYQAKDAHDELKVRTLHKGDKMHVLGIPRIDLALVAWRVAHAKERPEVLTWTLPYEIIVVGVYDE